MKSFTIRRFSGIETKFDSIDQNRGTVRYAIGAMHAPVGAMSAAAGWSRAFTIGRLSTTIDNYLNSISAELDRVHFVEFGRFNDRFVVAWQYSSNTYLRMPRGLWSARSSGDTTQFLQPMSVVKLAEVVPGAGKTLGADWFGTWIGNRLFLGNGIDDNLVWQSEGLYTLGPQTLPTDQSNPARYRIPPCTAFVRDDNGVIYAAGNRAKPNRIWMTERPTAAYPDIDGIFSLEWSFIDLIGEGASAITALSVSGSKVIAHLGVRGCIAVDAYPGEGSSDGWKGKQSPVAVAAGAPNPDCVRDLKNAPIYLGCDGEVYRPPASAGAFDERIPRHAQILTTASMGDWQGQMGRPISTPTVAEAVPRAAFTVYDEYAGRFWMWVDSALWIYDHKNNSISGRFIFPHLRCVTAGVSYAQCMAFGILKSGEFVYNNLSTVGSDPRPTLPAIPLPSAYAPKVAPPSQANPLNAAWSDYVGIDETLRKFAQICPWEQNFAALNEVWDDALSASLFFPIAQYFHGARLMVIELSPEDMTMPDGWKEFVQVRLHWSLGAIAYAGVFAEADGRRTGKWRGTSYPRREQICGIGISGRSLRLRIIAVLFNNRRDELQGLTIDYLPGGKS